jgi:hypothetical protein
MTALIPTPWSSNNAVPTDVEEAIEAINNSRRRHVLCLLDDQDGAISAGQLARAIAAIEMDKEICDLTAQERKRVYISLYQGHLDTLDEVGAVNYNERSKEVHATEATAGLAELVRHLESICQTD